MLHELLTRGRRQFFDRALVRARDPHFQPHQQRTSHFGQFGHFLALVATGNLALDKASLDKSRNHIGRVGAIQTDRARQRNLLGRPQLFKRGQDAVLHRRNPLRRTLLEKQRDVNLMQPANQKAGPRLQRSAAPIGRRLHQQVILAGNLAVAILITFARRVTLTCIGVGLKPDDGLFCCGQFDSTASTGIFHAAPLDLVASYR